VTSNEELWADARAALDRLKSDMRLEDARSQTGYEGVRAGLQAEADDAAARLATERARRRQFVADVSREALPNLIGTVAGAIIFAGIAAAFGLISGPSGPLFIGASVGIVALGVEQLYAAWRRRRERYSPKALDRRAAKIVADAEAYIRDHDA
jgi:hypothetical protein